MNTKPLLQQIKNLPDTPGVYFFLKRKVKGEGRKVVKTPLSTLHSPLSKHSVLYIGKATSLKDRVKSYFGSDLLITRSALIEKMVLDADDIDFQKTDSVLEALILEANLIKRYQPTYNTKEKDGKSFNYVVITKEDFPRVFVVRGKELQTKYDPDDFKHTFGPYTSGGALKEALKIIRKIFPFRGEKDSISGKRKSRLNIEIGIVPDLSDSNSQKEYSKTIRNIVLFFQGKKSQILKNLNKDMKMFAKKREFEIANNIKRKIFALGHINDVAILKGEGRGEKGVRVEAYDVAHTSGKDMVGVMTVIEDGLPNKSEYRKFNIKSVSNSNDTAALKEILIRRFGHDDWTLPALIVLDGGKAQMNVGEKVLEEFGYQIPLVSTVKDERHNVREILGNALYRKKYEKEILLANHEAHRFAISFHRKKRSSF